MSRLLLFAGFSATVSAFGGSCDANSGDTTVSGHCRSSASPSLPLDDVRLRRKDGAVVAEQVHLIGGTPGKVAVVWAAPEFDRTRPPGVEYCLPLASDFDDCTSALTVDFEPAGAPWTYTAINNADDHPPCNPVLYTEVSCYYGSPWLFAVEIDGLAPGATYLYRIRGEGDWRRVRMPPKVGEPISFGVVADLGQTGDSHETMERMLAQLEDCGMDAVIFPGDLAYADGWSPRWDSYGRLAEPLFSRVPTAYTVGNHEVASGSENMVHFTNRYPALFLKRDSYSSSDTWFSYDAGLAHVIMLCSYCPFSPGTPQRTWLEQDLQQVDRSRSPWLILSWHTPWYNSNQHHPMSEGEEMRRELEDLIHSAGADVVFAGHVHAYERTHPVFHNQTDLCDGTTYITIGDGGNREGFANPWVTPMTPAPPLYDKPSWSAVREFAFGHGRISLHNKTHAHWQWYRNDHGNWDQSDSVWLTRGSARAASCLRGRKQGARLLTEGGEILV